MKEYLRDVDEVIREQGTGEGGLSSEEAAKRLEENGKNKLMI